MKVFEMKIKTHIETEVRLKIIVWKFCVIFMLERNIYLVITIHIGYIRIGIVPVVYVYLCS